ncbi:MAG: iron-containing alcohol dehydrogenase, partial [Oscillospiraceae bacterium]|nr:iron-containing alcohol dehydrogenase [Oscillospiraceae bacterium]
MFDCNFHMPVRMISGKDCVVKNSAEFAKLGKRCLIITGRTSAKKCGALDDCIDALTAHDIAYRVFDKVEQNPTFTNCTDAGRAAADFKADFIVGIGGGSPLDVAKAA